MNRKITIALSVFGALGAGTWAYLHQAEPLGVATPAFPIEASRTAPPQRPENSVESPKPARTEPEAVPMAREIAIEKDADSDSSSPYLGPLEFALSTFKAQFDQNSAQPIREPALAALSVVATSIMIQLERAGRYEKVQNGVPLRSTDLPEGTYRIPFKDRVYMFHSAEFPEYERLIALAEANASKVEEHRRATKIGQIPVSPLELYEPLPADLLAGIDWYVSQVNSKAK